MIPEKMTYNLRLDESEIKKALQNIIVGPSKKFIIDVISQGLLDTDTKAQILMKAVMGIEYKLNFKKGDKVFVNYSHTATWRHNKIETEKKFCVKQGYIIATIEDIRPYRSSEYTIAYPFIAPDGTELMDTYEVPQNFLELVDDLKLECDDEQTKEEVSVSGEV